jgi:hypothetical protein
VSAEPVGRGVRAIVSDEEILRWLEVPPEGRLEWLEELTRLVHLAQTEESREAMRRFREESL